MLLHIYADLQAALIGLKIDLGPAMWEWRAIMFPSWILFIIVAFYGLGIFLVLGCLFFSCFHDFTDRYHRKSLTLFSR